MEAWSSQTVCVAFFHWKLQLVMEIAYPYAFILGPNQPFENWSVYLKADYQEYSITKNDFTLIWLQTTVISMSSSLGCGTVQVLSTQHNL